MLLLTLFIQLLILLLGIVFVNFFGVKGYFINLAIVTIIVIYNDLLVREHFLVILLIMVGIYFLARYIVNYVKKAYDPLPIREMVLGGSAVGLLAGMIVRPIFVGIILGPVLGVPLLRRLARLGLKAVFLTFGGFLLRLLFSVALNVYIIFKLL